MESFQKFSLAQLHSNSFRKVTQIFYVNGNFLQSATGNIVIRFMLYLSWKAVANTIFPFVISRTALIVLIDFIKWAKWDNRLIPTVSIMDKSYNPCGKSTPQLSASLSLSSPPSPPLSLSCPLPPSLPSPPLPFPLALQQHLRESCRPRKDTRANDVSGKSTLTVQIQANRAWQKAVFIYFTLDYLTRFRTAEFH